MTDQHPEPVWYSPPVPWWYSGMKLAALVFLVNSIALEWAILLLHPEPGWIAPILAFFSLLGAVLMGAWSTVRTDGSK